ncbi:hypothetical protein ElyMa_000183100 [Elysia marginata]|uniref:Apple domain-containing protein n=1 Tax=Elysia marginata TaxID=1093978 RepID=A0AAV4EWC6_9GAST|nr:hypothetical protein ElyMa_000183100 [Elysia marginata]
MSSSREKPLLRKHSPLLDIAETTELPAPYPISSSQESPKVGENQRKIALQRYPRQSIDGVQVYRDVVNSHCCRMPISMISDPQNTGGDPNSTVKGSNDLNTSEKNGLAKKVWRSKRAMGSLAKVESNEQTKKEKRRGSSVDRRGTLSLTSPSSSPSISPTMSSQNYSNSLGIETKLRTIDKFSTCEKLCKNKTVDQGVADPLKNGDVCVMDPNKILKVSYSSNTRVCT